MSDYRNYDYGNPRIRSGTIRSSTPMCALPAPPGAGSPSRYSWWWYWRWRSAMATSRDSLAPIRRRTNNAASGYSYGPAGKRSAAEHRPGARDPDAAGDGSAE